MADLDICACGLARDVLEDDETVTLVCEHCDRPCDEKRCAQCASLARTQPRPA